MVHTLPIINFQPADPTCGQAMCGVELVAPTPLVAALTERLLGLRCLKWRGPVVQVWGPTKIHPQVDEVQAGLRLQDLSSASQKKSWVTKSVSTQTLRGNVFFPSPVPRSQAAGCSLVLLVFVTSKAAMPPTWGGWSRWLPCLDLWSGDPPNISNVRFIKINPQEGGAQVCISELKDWVVIEF